MRPPRRPPSPQPTLAEMGEDGEGRKEFFLKELFLAVLTRQPFFRRYLAPAPRTAGYAVPYYAWIAPLA